MQNLSQFLIFLCLISRLHPYQAKFDPYADNGGTIAGIAGDSFCVIAADTRLSEQYMVRSREIIRLFDLEEENDNQVVFGGCGCWADIVALAKALQHNARIYRWKHRKPISTSSTAHLLLQLLYARRLFPYYSFSVLGSVDEDGVGELYRFDCVGSFEKVPVVCAGKGEHMIQPFLDRLSENIEADEETWTASATDSFEGRDRICVRCTSEEAVSLLVQGFRSAAEREITVGDGVQLWILRRGEKAEKRVYSLPKM